MIKDRLWHILEANRDTRPARVFRWALVILIVLNSLAIVLESCQELQARLGQAFRWFELVSVAIFSLEYLARLACCTADARFGHPILGRLKWLVQPMSVVDLVAVAPFFIPSVLFDLRFVRMLRVLRILRVARMGRFSSALGMTFRVFQRKRQQLFSSLVVVGFWVFLASCIMYLFEREAQPDTFGSIPHTLWWAVVTLTTIGYGDVYPVTAGGKAVACLFALIGIGIVALPTGILASGFTEELDSKHTERRRKKFCSNCGEKL